MRVLALDVGTVRIGVAVTDEEGKYALAYSVIPAEPRSVAIAAVLDILRTEKTERILVGLPLRLDGTEGQQVRSVRDFIEDLQKQDVPAVEYIDERFTTSVGTDVAKLKGASSPDAEAARLILQTWLDRQSLASPS